MSPSYSQRKRSFGSRGGGISLIHSHSLLGREEVNVMTSGAEEDESCFITDYPVEYGDYRVDYRCEISRIQRIPEHAVSCH